MEQACAYVNMENSIPLEILMETSRLTLARIKYTRLGEASQNVQFYVVEQSEELKIVLKNLISRLFLKFIERNIFSEMDPSNDGDRPLADQHGRSLEERAKEKGVEIKEDIKRTARRVEGELKDDEGLRQEHDPSVLERAGETLKGAAQAIGDKMSDISQSIGLTSGKKE